MTKESVVKSQNGTSNVIGFVNSRKHGIPDSSSLAPANMNDITEVGLNREELAMYFKYGMDQVSDQIAAIQKRNNEMVLAINTLGSTMTKVAESLIAMNNNVLNFQGDYNASKNNLLESTKDIAMLTKALGRAMVKVNEDANESSGVTQNLLRQLIESNSNSYSVSQGLLKQLIETNSNSNSASQDLLNRLIETHNVSVTPQNPLKDNDAFSNTSDFEWLQKAWKSAEIIGRKAGKSKTKVLMDVYRMFRKDGIAIDDYMAKYRSIHPTNASYIGMIASNPGLRYDFQEYIKKLYAVYYPEKIVNTSNSDINASSNRRTGGNRHIMYHTTPDNIIAGVEKYRKKHSFKSNAAALRSLSRKMSKVGNVNMAQLRKDKALEVHYCYVSFGYLVNSDPSLRALFDKVVNEY